MKLALRVVVALVAFCTVLAVAGWFYFVGFSPDRVRFEYRGIDVSHHQGEIDWTRVAEDDVSFAYLKATEGGDHVDTKYETNVVEAALAGVPVGAYHFFTLCRPGSEQAENFLAIVRPEDIQLPPAVDLEYPGNCSHRPEATELRAELEAFLKPVEEAFGREVIFYSTTGFYWDYMKHLPERSMWVRWLALEPFGHEWSIWQYSDRGRIEGIDGDVDLNVLASGALLAE